MYMGRSWLFMNWIVVMHESRIVKPVRSCLPNERRSSRTCRTTFLSVFHRIAPTSAFAVAFESAGVEATHSVAPEECS